MSEFDKFFKSPDQDKIDRDFITQLCYDGQMDDDEIEEFVDAIIKWKNTAINENLFELIQKLKELPLNKSDYDLVQGLVISNAKKLD